LQPLDVCIFGPLKTAWDKELVCWQRLNPRKRIPKPDFVNILNKVYRDLDVGNITKGFAATGIYPVNREIIDKKHFTQHDMKKYEEWMLRRNGHDEEQDAVPMEVEAENVSQDEQDSVNNEKDPAPQTDEDRPSTSRGTILEDPDIPSVNSFKNILLSLVKEQKPSGETPPKKTRKRVCNGAHYKTRIC
jgi:hypothetical protein